MTCRDCLHYERCKKLGIYNIETLSICEDFTARSEWVHLPHKVGDVFFRTIPWRNTIDKCTVSSLTQKADETWKIRLTSGIFRTTFEITTNDIGKTVFLTQQEVEKTLEEQK